MGLDMFAYKTKVAPISKVAIDQTDGEMIRATSWTNPDMKLQDLSLLV